MPRIWWRWKWSRIVIVKMDIGGGKSVGVKLAAMRTRVTLWPRASHRSCHERQTQKDEQNAKYQEEEAHAQAAEDTAGQLARRDSWELHAQFWTGLSARSATAVSRVHLYDNAWSFYHAGGSVHLAGCHYDYDTHPMKTEFPNAGRLFRTEHFPSLNLSLDVTRGQFSDMLRMLEAKRLRDFHFTLEDEAEDSWSIYSWGMSAALLNAIR
jgi:hypothetical protein